jgi:[CysO sulfur-carrier protein]-S-L-cysteine hydrolase
MNIAQSLLDDVIAHAREEYDAECCGMIAYAPADAYADTDDIGTDPDAGADPDAGVDPDADTDSGGEPCAVQVHRATNIFASRKRFEIDGREVLSTMNEFEDAGWELGAIYHSHTHTDPYPSQTDINFAANWPDLEWVIVGLAGDAPEVRCYLIEDGTVREVGLTVR